MPTYPIFLNQDIDKENNKSIGSSHYLQFRLTEFLPQLYFRYAL